MPVSPRRIICTTCRNLITDFREELLTFNCDTERPSFLRAGGSPIGYEEHWARLAALRARDDDS